jgi:hypothetical protein
VFSLDYGTGTGRLSPFRYIAKIDLFFGLFSIFSAVLKKFAKNISYDARQRNP